MKSFGKSSFHLCLLLLALTSIGCPEQFVPTRPSNPAPRSQPGVLAINESGSIQYFDSLSVTYLRDHDSGKVPIFSLVAFDHTGDTVRLNLAHFRPDTDSYSITSNSEDSSNTFAYFAANVFYPPPYGEVVGYFLLASGYVQITTFDTVSRKISGVFSFDQDVGHPKVRLYLDGTFNAVPYSIR